MTACIHVLQVLLTALCPLSKGMTILKKGSKNTALFDAPATSGNHHTMTGVHWPVYTITDVVAAHHLLPVITGQNCNPLHNATAHQDGDAV